MSKILVLGQEGASKGGFSGQESGTLIIFGGYAEEKFSRDETVVIAFANAIDDQFTKADTVSFGFPIFQEDTRQMIEDEKIAETSMPADNPPRAEAVIIRNP